MTDLTEWYLTLPTGKSNNPTLIKPPKLATYHDDNFKINADKSITFTAPCSGVTTDNTNYPRCELRELVKGKNASWSMTKEKNTLTYTCQVVQLPVKKPEVVVGQIHGPSDDVVEIRLSSKTLVAMHNSTVYGTLDDHYILGTKFTVEIQAQGGRITVLYNGASKAIITKPADTENCYFKVGSYVQSNKSKGDAGHAAVVVLYSVVVTHT